MKSPSCPLVLLSLIHILSGGLVVRAADLSALVKRSQNGVLLVESLDANNTPTVTGTGFFITPQGVLVQRYIDFLVVRMRLSVSA
jgi:C4-type Zn-finger protein